MIMPARRIEIRRRYLDAHWSVQKIAMELGIYRETVRAALKDETGTVRTRAGAARAEHDAADAGTNQSAASEADWEKPQTPQVLLPIQQVTHMPGRSRSTIYAAMERVESPHPALSRCTSQELARHRLRPTSM